MLDARYALPGINHCVCGTLSVVVRGLVMYDRTDNRLCECPRYLIESGKRREVIPRTIVYRFPTVDGRLCHTDMEAHSGLESWAHP